MQLSWKQWPTYLVYMYIHSLEGFSFISSTLESRGCYSAYKSSIDPLFYPAAHLVYTEISVRMEGRNNNNWLGLRAI